MPELRILDCFDRSNGAMSSADIIRATSLPRSTVFRALRTLSDMAFVSRDPETKTYTLGPRVLQLGMLARSALVKSEIISGPLVALAGQTRETLTFSILDIPWRTCVYAIEAENDLRQVVEVGARYPLHLGAAGKVILANLPTDTAEAILEQQGLSPLQHAAILAHIGEIRASGYAITTGERVPGASTVAAPVFVRDNIFASVAVVGPTSRIEPLLEGHRVLVVQTARLLSERLSTSAPASAPVSSSRAPATHRVPRRVRTHAAASKRR